MCGAGWALAQSWWRQGCAGWGWAAARDWWRFRGAGLGGVGVGVDLFAEDVGVAAVLG
ncbi:hypothetical protein FHU30_007865 [Actinomadura rupiterrae]|nr:hypothetical protein [Actinomadura rupiterrae]